eukprot:scaffold53430_cov60-Cyclotella_meneghiniana.AAC.3
MISKEEDVPLSASLVDAVDGSSKDKAQHQLGIGSSYSITKQDWQVATKKKREAQPPRIIIVGTPIRPILKWVSYLPCRHGAVSINETIPSPS